MGAFKAGAPVWSLGQPGLAASHSALSVGPGLSSLWLTLEAPSGRGTWPHTTRLSHGVRVRSRTVWPLLPERPDVPGPHAKMRRCQAQGSERHVQWGVAGKLVLWK